MTERAAVHVITGKAAQLAVIMRVSDHRVLSQVSGLAQCAFWRTLWCILQHGALRRAAAWRALRVTMGAIVHVII